MPETIQFSYFPPEEAHLAQAALGTVNMALHDSVIIRVCTGIERSYKIVQSKGKNNKIYLPVLSFLKLVFLWVWRGFSSISVGFSFSVEKHSNNFMSLKALEP